MQVRFRHPVDEAWLNVLLVLLDDRKDIPLHLGWIIDSDEGPDGFHPLKITYLPTIDKKKALPTGRAFFLSS